MDYSYKFNDKKKLDIKKIIFIIVFVIIIIIITTFFLRKSENKLISKVSNIISKPLQIVFDFSSNMRNSISSYFSNKKEISSENDNLKKQIESLKYQLLETKKIEDENISLKQMLEIKKSYQHFNLVTGKIIYREHDNWSQTFKIDIGQNDGIKLNQAVIATEGLVGYISDVKENYSTVTTILDPSTSVSVTTSTLNEPAVLKGDLELKSENKLKLDFIQLNASVSISDIIYTSGLGLTYPSSIPVGKIIEVVNSKSDINRYAIVEPNVNIKTIKEVGVII